MRVMQFTRGVVSPEIGDLFATDDTDEALSLARTYPLDAIAIDADAPGASDVLLAIRRAAIKTPIVWIGRRADTVRVLDSGADAVLERPFLAAELMAQLRAVVRRSHGLAQNIVTVGDLSVNIEARVCCIAGHPIHLTGKEFKIIELLALRVGQGVSKEAFLDHLYGGMDEPELKIIDVFACKLRRKLGAMQGAWIETRWGYGYALVAEPCLTAPTHRSGPGARGA